MISLGLILCSFCMRSNKVQASSPCPYCAYAAIMAVHVITSTGGPPPSFDLLSAESKTARASVREPDFAYMWMRELIRGISGRMPVAIICLCILLPSTMFAEEAHAVNAAVKAA